MLLLHGPVPDIVVSSPTDAVKWCEHGLTQAAFLNGRTEVGNTLRDRIITTSCAFAGVATEAVSCSVITHTTRALLLQWGIPGEPPKFVHKQAIEKTA